MSTYVQHEYALNQPNQPWSLGSNNTELSSVLDGDEELLILDNSKLCFDEELTREEDFCLCSNCRTNNQLKCLSNNNNLNSNGIAMISTGAINDDNWTVSPSTNVGHNCLEPSINPYSDLGDQHRHQNHCLFLNDNSNRHSDIDPEASDGHNWSTHCHPNQTSGSEAISKANRQLIIGCILCLVFMFVEFIGGFLSNSLAIMTDAAHLLSDLASFLLSLFAVWLSQRRPTKRMSFGFYRAEVLGAATSVFMIWVLTGILFYLAVDRIRNTDYAINSTAMLIVSGCGVGINIVMGLTLSDVFCGKKSAHVDSGMDRHHGHSHGGHSHSHSHSNFSHGHSHTNMNVRAALIHVLGDLIQSIGVLIASLIIHYKPEYKMADPICTFIFSCLVMFTTFGIMKDAVYVLMEGFPQHIDYITVKKDLMDIELVQSAHSLHIWSLTLSKIALSVHLAVSAGADTERILKLAENLIRKKYDIQHTTIQVEKYDIRVMSTCVTCKGP